MLLIVSAVLTLMLIGVLFALAIVSGGTGRYSPTKDLEDRLAGMVLDA